MIGVNEWREYLQRLAAGNEWIRHWELVVNIAQLKDRVKELGAEEYPLLAGIVPFASSGSMDEDNISEMNVLTLLVLIPIEREDGEEEELQKLEETQMAITQLKRTIREDYFTCSVPLMNDVKFKSFTTDPQYNLMGYMGWSFSFEIETDEYGN